MSLHYDLLVQERKLLQPATRANPEAVAALLSDDFREFGSSGRVYTKAEILVALAAEVPRNITLGEFTCHSLAPNAALVTYRSRSEAGDALRSSVWVRRDGHWRMRFHQGTKLPAPSVPDAVS